MRRTRSLLGTAARTAVITGTAKAVLGSGRKGEAVPAEAPAPAPGMTEDRIAMLQKLSELQKSGVLTDEEFAAEKAKILAG